MANCVINGATIGEIKDSILKNKLAPKITEVNQSNVVHSLLAMRGIFKIAEVEARYLDATLRKSLYLEDTDLVETYVNPTTGEVAVRKRATMDSAAKFYKVLGEQKAKLSNTLADNKIKADGGTRVHLANQLLMELLIQSNIEKNTGAASHIINNRDVEGYNPIIKELSAISQETNIKEGLLRGLAVELNNVLSMVNEKQKSIDKDGKAMIFTETLITDGKDLGGTVDLLVVFSDGSVGKFDYKTMNPFDSKVTQSGLYKITSEDWISTHKHADFILQFNNLDKILNSLGMTKRNFSRIIPIHTRYKLKHKDNRTEGSSLTNEITQLSMGVAADEFLKHVPIGEVVGIEALDEKINTLYTIINNLRHDLSKEEKGSSKAIELAAEITRKQRVVNGIILDADLEIVFKEIRVITNKYADKMGTLFNIKDELIDGEPNPNYMDITEIHRLKTEIAAYKNILNSSREFIIELENVPNAKTGKYIQSMQELVYITSQMETELLELEKDIISGPNNILDAMQDQTKGSFWNNMFRTLNDQIGPLFRIFSDKINEANDKTRVASMEHDKKTKKFDLAVSDWARRNGVGLQEAFDKYLIDKDSGNLIKKYSSLMYEELAKIQEDGTDAQLDAILELKEGWEVAYNNRRDSFIDNNNLDLEVDADNNKLKRWELSNSPLANKRNTKYFGIYYKIKEDIKKKYYTKEYQFVSKSGNEALLNFYNHWTDSMELARHLFGMSYQEIPNNFLAWIRADAMEMIVQGGYTQEQMRDYFESLMNVKEDDLSFGIPASKLRLDPRTNELLRDVPKWFTTPLKDNHGRINAGLKSRDLSKSLSIFMNAAYQYNNKINIVEPYVESLKDIALDMGVKNQIHGKDIKGQGIISKLKGANIDSTKALNTTINYHLYGITIQDADPKVAKRFMQAKKYQSMKELAFAVLTGVGNALQIRSNAYFEGVKGYFYDNTQLNRASGMGASLLGTEKKVLYDSIIEFLEPSVGIQGIRAKNMSSKKALKVLNWDTAFIQFRKPEEILNNNMLVAVMQNYGWDANGNLQRLKNLPVNTKSILDGAKIVGERLVIDGITDAKGEINWKNYTNLRRLSLQVAKAVKGQMNAQDTYNASNSLVWNLALGFKNWLPGMLDERISAVRFDPSRNAVLIGRWTALTSDMADSEKSVASLMYNVVLPSTLRLAGDIATFGWLFNHGLKYKVNEHRARAQFENYKSKYLHDTAIQQMKFEDFLEYKQGQIRALAAELFTVLSLVLLLMLAAQDWDDDGKPDYKASIYSRTVYRMLNRARREIAFFISPNDWTNLIRSPIPLTGLAVDAIRWIENTGDSFGDIVWGEDTKRTGLKAVFGQNKGKDKRPIGYETFRWAPGHKLFKSLEVFPTHEDSVY